MSEQIDATQLSQKLAPDRGVTLSSARVRKVLKKRCDPAEVSSAWERAPRQRGGVGRGQDINNHLIPIRNKNKPNKLIRIGCCGHTVQGKFASNSLTSRVLAYGVQLATPIPEGDSRKYSNRQPEEVED